MKNKIFVYVLVFLIVSIFCSIPTVKNKILEKKMSHLKIQTQLNNDEKKYYLNIHSEINSAAKHFAYREPKINSKLCPKLLNMYDEISTRPYSVERERERERIISLLINPCNTHNDQVQITKEEIEYLRKKLPNSSTFMNVHDEKRLEDSLDLIAYKDYLEYARPVAAKNREEAVKNFDYIKRQYCLKAVEQKQWDHIYYLTDIHGASDITDCLNPKSEYHKYCECPEAMKLAIKGWSKEHLLSSEFVIPDADPVDTVQVKKELKRAIKEAVGRDLDKEPPVSEI